MRVSDWMLLGMHSTIGKNADFWLVNSDHVNWQTLLNTKIVKIKYSPDFKMFSIFAKGHTEASTLTILIMIPVLILKPRINEILHVANIYHDSGRKWATASIPKL